MAELPPLSQLPDSGLSPEFVGQLEHSANWARRFGGGDTNIALRHRHNQDIEAYANALQQQREAEQERLLQTNKRAQDYAFGVRRLDMQEREARARMAHADAMFPLQLEAKEAQIKADLTRQRSVARADLLKSRLQRQEDEDNDAFLSALSDAEAKGIKQGTPEWADAITSARISSPSMRSEIFDDLWKTTARSALSPQEAIDNAVAKQRALNELKTDDRELKALERERKFYSDAFETARAQRARVEGKGDDLVKAADADVLKYQNLLNNSESQLRSFREPPAHQPVAATAPASERIATNPQTGEKVALRDGKWVPLK